jgi:hypothetical protein
VKSMKSMELSKEMQTCIDACLSCYTRCEEALNHCLQQGGQHADPQMIRTLTDCAEMSRMCAEMMMRMSPMSSEMCAMVARMCDMCADACMRMPDDAMMMRCADSCTECAQACRAMMKTMA